MFLGYLLYRIVTAFTPRITPQDAPNSLWDPAENTILLNGLVTIFRAAWRKLTVSMRKKDFWEAMIRRERLLIETNQPEQRFTRQFQCSLEECFEHAKIKARFSVGRMPKIIKYNR